MSRHLVISNWHGCYSAKLYVCVCVCLDLLQRHSSVGQLQLSLSSGLPVYPASIRWVAQRFPSVHWFNQWHSSLHWASQCALAQGKGTNKLQWNLKRNWFILNQENAFENVVSKMVSISVPPQWVDRNRYCVYFVNEQSQLTHISLDKMNDRNFPGDIFKYIFIKDLFFDFKFTFFFLMMQYTISQHLFS